MKKYLFVLIFFVIAALSASYYAPYYAVHTLQKAAAEGDLSTIEEYVDFDKVRKQEQGKALQKDNADNDMIQAAVIAAILAESVASETNPKTLDMVMGYSGDDHFILSLEKTIADNSTTTSAADMTPVIFVLEKKNFYTWHVTEILINE